MTLTYLAHLQYALLRAQASGFKHLAAAIEEMILRARVTRETPVRPHAATNHVQ